MTGPTITRARAAQHAPDAPRCPHCEDGTKWVSRYGGNDPDVWAVECDDCDGGGNVRCDEPGCREIATRVFEALGENYCERHFAAWAADSAAEAGEHPQHVSPPVERL